MVDLHVCPPVDVRAEQVKLSGGPGEHAHSQGTQTLDLQGGDGANRHTAALPVMML